MNLKKRSPLLYILTLTLTMVLILGSTLTVWAQTGKVTGSVINIRSGPSTNNEIVGNLYQDTEVNILTQQNGWYQISYGKVSGWVSADYIEAKQTRTVKITGEVVNLRASASTSSAIVTKLNQGTVVTLLDIEGEWYKVKTAEGSAGYVAAYLAEASTAAAPQTTPATPPVETPSPTPTLTPPANTGAASGELAVFLDSKPLNFEVAPMIENGRTLVPLRAIFEAMGATVEWNDATKTVIATKGNNYLVLTIGSTEPTVNGAVWPIDVPAKIVKDRTMAPLRFVGEAFGGQVDWNDATRTISMFSPSTSQPVEEGKNPSTVIIANEVNLRTGPDTAYSSIDRAQPGERLAILDQQDGWYQVSRGGIRSWVASWVVDVAWEESESHYEPEPEPELPPEPQPEEIKENVIKLSYTKDGAGITLKMTSGGIINPEVEKTSTGFTYTIRNKKIEGLNLIREDIGTNQLKMKGINSGDDAVISIEIPSGIEYHTEFLEKGKVEAIIIPNFIMSIDRKAFGSTGERLIMTTMSPVEYTKSQQGDAVIIELPGLLLGKAREEYTFNSSLIKKTTLKEVSGKTPGVIMTIDTNELGQSSAGLGSDNSLNIMLRGKSEIKPVRENLIVIDPGHGGSDTGARGPTLNEKEVNLDIALQAGNLLKQKGYDVEYTRTGDIYVGLEERAIIANNLNAALFVSVHNNSFTTNDKMGTETYFYAPVDNPNLFLQKDEREKLAKILQNQLLSKLKRIDRGAKEKNLSVLRNTQMVSALVEIMFINNPTEESLLKQPHIRTLAAEAIADGIDQYMRSR